MHKEYKLILILLTLLVSISNAQIPSGAIAIEDVEFNDYFFKETPPVVKGRVLNITQAEIDSLHIKYSLPTPVSPKQIVKTTKINSDGTFELEIDYPFPYQQIWFRLEPFIYSGIYVNSELYIELDASVLRKRKVYMIGEGVEFKGSDGELNVYMNNYVRYKNEEKCINRRILSEYNLSNGFDSIYSRFIKIDNDYIDKNPSKYSWLIRNDRLSDYYKRICSMYYGKEMSNEVWEKVKAHKVYLTSNKGMYYQKYLLNYLRSLTEEYDYNKFRSYSKLTQQERTMIDSVVTIKKRNFNSPSPEWGCYNEYANKALTFLHDTFLVSNTTRCIELIDSIYPSPKADMLKLRFDYEDPSDKKIILDVVHSRTVTEWCNKVNTEQYRNNEDRINYIKSKLNDAEILVSDNRIGTPLARLPFDAELYLVDSIGAVELMAKMKNKFKGKALLIDFWATWCSPCLREMPKNNQLRHELKGAPIEFVYCCTSQGSSIKKWKSKIVEQQVAGTHLFIDAAIHDELMRLFSLSAVPSYIFIGRNGNYKPGVVSRPSNISTSEFEKLIYK